MSSREDILNQIKNNQPVASELPDLEVLKVDSPDLLPQFIKMLNSIGGHAVKMKNITEIPEYLKQNYPKAQRIINQVAEMKVFGENNWLNDDPHSLANVDLAVISGHFGVAENGSIWITDDLMGQRVAPFICQQLVVILNKNKIVANMHFAYGEIAKMPNYDFATFLAGPSKTADIEQSLVLGAHGARDLLVILI